jgi:predicted nucleic-acid-binding protein
MIAVDTNVLLRRLLDDDAAQSARARRLFDAEAEILITDVVLAEAAWTLGGKRYKANALQIVEVVTSLLEEPNVAFEDVAAIWAAVNDYMNASAPATRASAADFADALIVNKAKATARLRAATYRGTDSFDEAALALDGMKSL